MEQEDVQEATVCKAEGVSDLHDLTEKQARSVIRKLKDMGAKAA